MPIGTPPTGAAARSVDWGDEHRALGPEGLAPLNLPDEREQVDALIEKHAPDVPRLGRAR